MGRFTSVDPENAGADPEFPQTWNAYAYVANNPLKYVDQNGEYLATAWTVANVAIGVASLASNIKQGNYVAAAVDAVGVALDVAAATTGLPGGAGTALRVARAANKLATATGAARTVDKVGDAAKGAKRVPNPGGRLGDDVTKTRTAEIKSEFEAKGFNVKSEVMFKTPGEEKSKRFADLVAVNKKTGEGVVIQIGNKNKRGDPVAQERRAGDDIVNSSELKDNRYRYEFRDKYQDQ